MPRKTIFILQGYFNFPYSESSAWTFINPFSSEQEAMKYANETYHFVPLTDWKEMSQPLFGVNQQEVIREWKTPLRRRADETGFIQYRIQERVVDLKEYQ